MIIFVFYAAILKVHISVALEVTQYTLFCLKILSIVKYPRVKLLDNFTFIMIWHSVIWKSFWFYYHACSSLNHSKGHYGKITAFNTNEERYFCCLSSWYITIISHSSFTRIHFSPARSSPLSVAGEPILLIQLHYKGLQMTPEKLVILKLSVCDILSYVTFRKK